MIIRSDAEIYSLVRSFETRTIAKSHWTHRTQLVVGLYYCHTLPFAMAKNVMRDGICWLNDTHGTPNTNYSGYHETLTTFWLKRIWNFVDEKIMATASLTTLANALIVRFNDPDLPLKYYSRELLDSAAARRDYLSPDLQLAPLIDLSVSILTLKPLA